MSNPAQTGDSVAIHYKGTLADGSVFDSSEGREPLEFTLGAGQVIEGFDKAVTGMVVGEKKSVTIPCAEAYGPTDPGLCQRVPRESLPPDLEPELGDQLQVSGPGGQGYVVTVTEMDSQSIVIDGNHPMAGKDLTFALELVSIG